MYQQESLTIIRNVNSSQKGVLREETHRKPTLARTMSGPEHMMRNPYFFTMFEQ